MAVIGGSIDSVSLAGRNFAVPADNEAQIKLGGKRNESQANGNGTARLIKTTNLAGVDGLQIEIDDARDDHQFLVDLANRNDYFDVAFTLVNGVVYGGSLQLEGDFDRSTQSSTASITLMGPSLDKF